jgi:hypothetical protein
MIGEDAFLKAQGCLDLSKGFKKYGYCIKRLHLLLK